MEEEILFRICSFSSDFDNYSPLSIMKQLFKSKHCSNVNNINKRKVQFNYIINDKIIYIQLYEISDLTKRHNICYCADFYLIFVNLNDEENKILNSLNTILLYINETYSSNTKCNILGIVNKNIEHKIITEKEMNDFISSKNINNYDYMEINPKEDIESAFRILLREIIENKANNKEEENVSMSQGICYIY